MQMFNAMQMIQMFNQFKSSPIQALSKFGVPQDMNNPNQIIQHLMNTGKMSQQQFNQLQQMAWQMQNNPQYQQMFKK